jgi:hypothetical protein
MTSHCYMCKKIQTIENTNIDKNRHTGFASRCIACKRLYEKERWKNHKDELYIKHRNYAKSESGKISFRQAYKKFNKSKKGKIANAKMRSKRRKLGFIILCPNMFSNETKTVWHHIDDEYVIAVPKQIHQDLSGTHNKNKHRENLLDIIELFYPENIYNKCLERTSNF